MQEENSWSNIYGSIVWRMLQATRTLISFLTNLSDSPQRPEHLFAEMISSLEERMQKEWESVLAVITENLEFKNQSLCDELKISDDLIPQEFICSISLQMIDNVPLYTPYTSKRYSQKSLILWMKEKPTDPITKHPITFQDLNSDYFLEKKIEVFMAFLKENFSLLKGSHHEGIHKRVTAFLIRLNENFNPFKSSNLDDLESFAKDFIETIKEEARHCQKALLTLPKKQMHLNLQFQFGSCFKQGFFNNQINNTPKTMTAYVKNNQNYVHNFINRYGSCYNILELNLFVTKNQIEKKFRQLALKYHPDKNPEHEEQFQKIKEARDILMDFLKRDFHDSYFAQDANIKKISI